MSKDVIHISDYVVRGFHLDYNGHVNNCRYLEFLEDSRWKYFAAFLDPSKKHHNHCQVVVVGIKVDFISPLKLSDVFRIENSISRIGNKSFTVKQLCRTSAEGLLVAEAEVTCVVIDRETEKALQLEGELASIVFEDILDLNEFEALREQS